MPTKFKIVVLIALLFANHANAQLTASFTPDHTSGCAPLIVSFTNTSTGSPDSTIWDFGNGGHSTYSSPSTTYNIPNTYTVTLTLKKGSTIKTTTVTITVYDTPTVSFSATPLIGCPPLHVNFTDASNLKYTGTGTYDWDFGDGFFSTSQNPSHDFAKGTYPVTLVVKNSHGCRSTLTKSSYITVYDHPSPSFTAQNTHYCRPPALDTFYNASTGFGTLKYKWRFGDGGTSNNLNPGHTYTTTGDFTVTLIDTDGHGCIDSMVRALYVHVHKPTANYTMSRTNACLNDTICFTNTSSGGYSSSYWDFGDGGNSLQANPCHAFADTGTRYVKLVVSDGYCTDTITKTVHIYPLPNAHFKFTPRYPCPAPQTIVFTDSTTGSTSWTWDFGDGGHGTGSNPSHTYSSNGQYLITLTATDGHGCQSSYVDTLNLKDFFVHIIQSKIHGCRPLTVDFSENVLTNVPYLSLYTFPVTYSWDFGDGGHGTGAIASHTYTDTGVFYAHITVTNPNGCTATDSVRIEVGWPPTASFTPARDTVCPFYALTFVNNSSVDADSFRWEFGDGFNLNITNHNDVSHEYGDTGLYKVVLHAYFNGCPDTEVHYIYVLPPIPAIRSIPPCPPISRHTYTFYDTASILMTTHLWKFGDGDTSTLDNPTHTYAALGNYTVRLIAYNSSSGCKDSASFAVSVIDPHVTLRALTDTAICRDQFVTMQADITGSTFAAFNTWYDSVGNTLSNSYGFPTYLATGTTAVWASDTMKTKGLHTMSVVLKDANGCFDTARRPNYITVAKPVAGFKGIPTIGCSPLTVAFTDTSKDVTGTFITTRAWTYGDAGVATVTTAGATYTYNTKGTYSVKLIVTDNIGCKDTLTKTDYITALKPVANFSASTTRPCIGDVVTFTNQSSIDTLHDTLYSTSWDFGDGGTSTVFAPTHVYKTAGNFTVRLIVQDVHGCRDTMSRTSYIVVTKPHADFTMDDSISICPPLIVHFTNTSSSGALGYAWDFDDGGNSTLTNPSHIFNTSKYYKVRLTAVDVNGCYDTAYKYVNIYGYNGGLTYFPLLGCSPLTVNFVASITTAPTIVWDFSDGVTTSASGSTTITHTYTTPGAYVPKLILGDGKGCNSASLGLDTIKVDAVIAAFWPKTPCLNDTVHFVDTSKSYFSPVTQWQWQFEDGSKSFIRNPTRYYDSLTTYPVYLLVVNGNGCRDSINSTVTIQPPPDISAGPDTVICVNDTAILSPTGGVSYVWSSAAYLSCNSCTNPKIAPTDTSYYYVKGTDIYGCRNYDTIQVSLQTKTTSFVDPPPDICQGESIHLRAYGAQHYSWTPPGTLDSTNIATPLAAPMQNTDYVMIATEGSCIPDTQYVTLVVHPKPTVNAGADQTIIGGATAQLQGTGTRVTSYLWAPPETLNCIECANPVSTPLLTTDYQLIGISEYGCRDTDSVRITVLCDKSQVFIPNAFTPNADGQNDVFFPRGVAISTIKSFRIYNRWGELVFEKTNININDEVNAWDGTFRGVKQDPGVYVYMMDAICQTGEEIVWKGDVTIIR